MTVKQVGRPSKANERMAEILLATVEVVARDGLAGVTFAKVAEAAGLQRTLVLHYFGSRDQLLAAFIDQMMGDIGTAILHRDSGERPLRERVASMFDPEVYQSRDDLVVWTEVVALSVRDAAVRERVHDLWTNRWLPDVEAQLAAEYPHAEADEVAATAYALACLFEAHWAFTLQDVVDERRRRQAERAALLILDRLGH